MNPTRPSTSSPARFRCSCSSPSRPHSCRWSKTSRVASRSLASAHRQNPVPTVLRIAEDPMVIHFPKPCVRARLPPILRAVLQLLTRRLRRVIALGVIGALIVAQSAMAAHACSMVLSNLPLSTPSEPMVTASEDGPSFGSADGAGAPIHDENSLALCHFHCKCYPQIDAYADAPTAPIAP